MLDIWREPFEDLAHDHIRVDRRLRLDVRLPAHRLLPTALVSPEKQIVVTAVCSARSLAEGRPPMGIAVGQQDVVRVYPLPDDPERCLEDFLSSPPSTRASWPSRSGARRRRSSASSSSRARTSRRRADNLSALCGGNAILIVAGFGVFVFIGISLMLARALSATGTERSRVLEIAQAQARGDAQAVLAQTPACAREPACVAATEAFVARLKRPGDVAILQYTPSVQLPLTRATGTGRVAWRAGPTAAGRPVRARAPRRAADRRAESSCSRSPRRSATRRVARAEPNYPPRPVLRLPVMRRSLRFLLPALALLVALPATASAEKPNEQALYQDGPDGRYLLDGDWLFRLDNEDQGVKQRFMR